MTTAAQSALRQLRSVMDQERSVTWTLQRIDASTLTVVFNPARVSNEMEDEFSVNRGEELQDIIIDVAYFGDTPPQRGESIVWGTRRLRFTHNPAGKLFDYHDTYHETYRIHTIRVPLDSSRPIPPPIDPPIEPPVEQFGYSPDSVDTYGNHIGDTYSPP